MDDEDFSTLATRLEEKKEPEPEAPVEQVQVPLIDTTEQHRSHLFDLNCKVCTGKIVPGDPLFKAISEGKNLSTVAASAVASSSSDTKVN